MLQWDFDRVILSHGDLIEFDARQRIEQAWKVPLTDAKGLTDDRKAYDAWSRAKAQEALAETGAGISHGAEMHEARTLVDRKQCGQSPA
jgi:hypothetical protein